MIAIAGCGDAGDLQRQAVSGFVTLNGVPLRSGVIRLIPTDKSGPGAMSNINDGAFHFSSIDGPVTARHRVEIEATDFHGFDIDNEVAFATAMQKLGRSPMAGNPIPAIYNRASILTAVVSTMNEHELRFDLKSESN